MPRVGPPLTDGNGTAGATATEGLRPPWAAQRRTWPLLPLAPLVVVVLGLLVTLAIGLVGVDHLARWGDDHAEERAALFADVMAARLGALPPDRRLDALQLAARRSGAEYVLVTPDAEVVADATLGTPDKTSLAQILARKKGEAMTRLGRARFAARPVGIPPASVFVVVLVREPAAPDGSSALVTALVALTTLLVGVAATVAYAVARDASRDVEFVSRRVRAMADTRVDPAGEPVPVRTLDEVGLLTAAFNDLVGRFSAAEKAYRQGLTRARSADKDRAAFLAAVSHELRSPLNAILGFADVLLTEVDGPLTAEAREEIEQIKGSGQHLLELINDILEFSALETGQLKLSRASIDIGPIVSEVVREAGVVAKPKQVDLRLDIRGAVSAHADARRVRQVVGNLVGNAIKFTQSGEVVVSVWGEGAAACVSVRDTGPGISEDEQRIIFEEYKQTREEKRKKRGTGLGLAIARRLVLLHGGTIHLVSQLGAGSTFTVRFPVNPPLGAAPVRPALRP